MINPSDDMKEVREVLTDPCVWPWISDDGCGSSDDFLPSGEGLYLRVSDDELMGYFVVRGVNSIMCEIHTALLPASSGRSRAFAKEVLEWIADNLGATKVITMVPEYNAKAKSLAEDSGFTVDGFIPNSWLKNGVLSGQYVMGVDLCQ